MLSQIMFFALIAIAYAMPEMWIHGCQPAVNEIVMGSHIKDDKDFNKCNLTLTALNQDNKISLRAINTSQNYMIQFRPNFGQISLHCLLSVTSGKIELGVGYGHKDKCDEDGMSGVLWKGIGDPDGVTDIPFLYTPNVGNPDVKFAVTCSEGIGTPVYQHALLIGNYALPKSEDGQASVALAVVVLLMIVLPISGIAIYCFWVKCKNRILNRADPPTVGTGDEEEEEEEKPEKPTKKKKDKYENIKDED